MKQSGKLWYNELKGTLKNLGYQPAITDPCVFTREHGNTRDIVAVYVDDLLVTGTADRDRLDAVVAELGDIYKITNLGEANHLLGIHIRQTCDEIHLDQSVEIQQVFQYIVRYVSCRMMNEWLPTSW